MVGAWPARGCRGSTTSSSAITQVAAGGGPFGGPSRPTPIWPSDTTQFGVVLRPRAVVISHRGRQTGRVYVPVLAAGLAGERLQKVVAPGRRLPAELNHTDFRPAFLAAELDLLELAGRHGVVRVGQKRR